MFKPTYNLRLFSAILWQFPSIESGNSKSWAFEGGKETTQETKVREDKTWDKRHTESIGKADKGDNWPARRVRHCWQGDLFEKEGYNRKKIMENAYHDIYNMIEKNKIIYLENTKPKKYRIVSRDTSDLG